MRRLILGKNATLLGAAWLAASAALVGCGLTWNVNPTAISASSDSIRAGQTLQLTTPVAVTGTALAFAVNGIAGGNSTVGTVDASGLYTAPLTVPNPDAVTVTGTLPSNKNQSAGSVTLSVLNPLPTLQALSPASLNTGSTSLTVTGTNFVAGSQVMWSGAPVTTTFVSSHQLTASIAAPLAGTFALTVRNPDPGSATTAPITVAVASPQTPVIQAGVLSLQPLAGNSVRAGSSLNFALVMRE